ncbi:MAG: DNA alkylation repair protein [Gemmatimonadaceae bacterium]|nr:DNA alkylation repair protein [Gemmatimonadaceae bacterium]
MPASGTIRDVLGQLEAAGTQRTREGMARFGIVAPRAFGVSLTDIQKIAKRVGRDHELALGLWKTGWYEARLLAAFVDDPACVSASQMDAWARDFDNWAVCDTLCFKLFDRTPHAWKKVHQWAPRSQEFVRRGAFALVASLGVHDRVASDAQFLATLPLIERYATDERNFVKKGVSWALRVVGRRSRALHGPALALARRLGDSDDAAARWIGKDASRELEGAVVKRHLARKAAAAGRRARR